jgi:hypothetical protein
MRQCRYRLIETLRAFTGKVLGRKRFYPQPRTSRAVTGVQYSVALKHVSQAPRSVVPCKASVKPDNIWMHIPELRLHCISR